MEKIYLDRTNKEYPYIFLPTIIVDHIKNGYSDSKKYAFLNIKEPEKKDSVEYYSRKFPELGPVSEIKINTILNLDYDSVDENLEFYTYSLGNYKLPKKPLLHNVKEKEYIDYDTFFTNFFNSLILIPIFGFFLFILYSTFGPIFISYEDNQEVPLLLYITVTSCVIYFCILIYALLYALFSKESFFFEKKIKIERTLLDEEKRKFLLDDYKIAVKNILKQYEKDFEAEWKLFEQDFNQKTSLANNGILKDRLNRLNEISLVDNRSNIKGKSELTFLKYLYEEFGRNIFTDYSPNTGRNPFQPDFILFDPEINFYIDIEIDEPYSLLDGTTIHHDRTKDEERNSFFNQLNWGIIRFTEKQVTETPDKCCLLIKEVLHSIKNQKEYIEHGINIESFWTHEEALIMKINDYRNSY